MGYGAYMQQICSCTIMYPFSLLPKSIVPELCMHASLHISLSGGVGSIRHALVRCNQSPLMQALGSLSFLI